MLTINLVSIFFAHITLVNIDKVKINENNLFKSIVDINIIHIFVETKTKGYEKFR